MHLSLSPFCHLCAKPCNAANLTDIFSAKGQQDNLGALLNLYIIPILFLPKDDKLCLCDTCKVRLQEWDCFINSCKVAQETIKNSSVKCSQNDLTTVIKRPVDSTSDLAAASSNSSKRKRSSNYCIARWCNTGNYQGVSLFRLPKERARALVWLSGADRADLKGATNLNSYYLCANHFTANMFTNKACNQLVRKAVPTVFPKSPYANRTILKKPASPMLPTQFHGVQLKSILPKNSLPYDFLPVQCPKAVINSAQRGEPKSNIALNISAKASEETSLTADGQNASFVLGVTPSKLPSNLVMLESNIHVVNSTSLPHASENDFTVSLDKPGCSSHSSSSAVVDEESLLYCYVESVSTSNPETASEPDQLKAGLLSSHTSQELLQGHCSETKLKPCTQEQKHFLEEIESCFTRDSFNSSTLLSVHQTSISQEPKKISIPFNKQSYQCTTSETFNVLSHNSHQADNYQSTVGSQDFLLPHISEKVKKSSPSFTEPSYCLRSIAPVSASDEVHPVSTDSNPILNQNNQLSSPHIGLFDLPTDDIQGTGNSSIINTMENLDELMDLDKYFEGR